MKQDRTSTRHARIPFRFLPRLDLSHLFSVTFAFAILAAIATNVAAEVLPLSNIFLVHEATQADQKKPDVRALPRGGFLAAWTGCVEDCPAGTPLVGRAFDRDGLPRYRARPFTTPFPTGAQDVQLAILGKRRTVAVWQSSQRDGSDHAVFGAIVDRNFREIGSDFSINLRHTLGSQDHPTVVATGEGFLVAWYDGGDGVETPSLISAQRFDRDGRRLADEITLATDPSDYAFYPEAAALRGNRRGDAVVVWESWRLDAPGSTRDIAAKFIDRDGNVSERKVLNTSASDSNEVSPSVAATDDGFIASWVRVVDGEVDVYARLFDNNGEAKAAEFRVNSYTNGAQIAPVVATSADGSFVVIWTSGQRQDGPNTQDGDSTGLYGQAFSPVGLRVGDEFQVSTKSKGSQGNTLNTTTAAFLNDTDFVVLWDDLDELQQLNWVYGRRFRVSTTSRLCGDAAGSDLTVKTADVLKVLRAAVGRVSCASCKCDVDGSGDVTAVDAQATLRASVGLNVSRVCPACE